MYTFKNKHKVFAHIKFTGPLQNTLIRLESEIIKKAIELRPLFIELFK